MNTKNFIKGGLMRPGKIHNGRRVIKDYVQHPMNPAFLKRLNKIILKNRRLVDIFQLMTISEYIFTDMLTGIPALTLSNVLYLTHFAIALMPATYMKEPKKWVQNCSQQSTSHVMEELQSVLKSLPFFSEKYEKKWLLATQWGTAIFVFWMSTYNSNGFPVSHA
ncbi:hypothetical protein L596_030126 [Steinernema carpocapsae]|uniref:Uncharacterized protein n=1 Tax=Steinernema carpocapsae TaxID=34508 RepID=A0A4U5LRT7_STECR|nr:hypothetical protein L596_030126 [Steinernema carpocapsae]